jgi:hypothetical protein
MERRRSVNPGDVTRDRAGQPKDVVRYLLPGLEFRVGEFRLLVYGLMFKVCVLGLSLGFMFGV